MFQMVPKGKAEHRGLGTARRGHVCQHGSEPTLVHALSEETKTTLQTISEQHHLLFHEREVNRAEPLSAGRKGISDL